MSEEAAELGLRFAAALAKGDVPDELLAPDFYLETVDTPLIQGTYVGREGLRQWIADFLGVFEPGTARYTAEPTNHGSDVVVAKITLSGRGRVSGAPLDLTHWGALWVREGKIARATGYATRREALDATGLVK